MRSRDLDLRWCLTAALVSACAAESAEPVAKDGVDGLDEAAPQPEPECGLDVPTAGAWGDGCVDGVVAGQQVMRLCDDASRQCHRYFEADCADGYCLIPAGSWPTDTPWLRAQPVVITRPFLLGQYEVTVGDWLALMGGEVPSAGTPLGVCREAWGDACPMMGMTFFDVLVYANRLSERSGLESCYQLEGCGAEPAKGHGRICEDAYFGGPDCQGFRLPSEWEWELAATGGERGCIWGQRIQECWDCNDHRLDCESALSKYPDVPAWYECTAKDPEGCDPAVDLCMSPRAVGLHARNRFGLYDLHGNAAELTGSAYVGQMDWPPPVDAPVGVHVDPGFDRVLVEGFDASATVLRGQGVITRGGSYHARLRYVCAMIQNSTGLGEPRRELPRDGFRLARTVAERP